MTSDLLLWLACPADGAAPLALSVTRQAGPDVVERGALTCPVCGRTYPIEDGIPRLLPDPETLPPDERAEKERERNRRDAEAGVYDANRMLRILGRWEIPATLRELSPRPEECVVEVGCGTGRFTEQIAPRCRRVLAFDFSIESLKVARSRVPSPSVQFLQADACRLPLRAEVADRALSCQMLEHLPSPAARGAAVAQIARALRPGGTCVVSAYWHSPFTRLAGSKQGHHDGAIYFYRFDRREFRELLETRFEVRSLTARLIYVLLARVTRRSDGWPDAAVAPSMEHGTTPIASIGPAP
jgi:ubiquinone/menaquinone biosynthesis C-methylase UbiE